MRELNNTEDSISLNIKKIIKKDMSEKIKLEKGRTKRKYFYKITLDIDYDCAIIFSICKKKQKKIKYIKLLYNENESIINLSYIHFKLQDSKSLTDISGLLYYYQESGTKLQFTMFCLEEIFSMSDLDMYFIKNDETCYHYCCSFKNFRSVGDEKNTLNADTNILKDKEKMAIFQKSEERISVPNLESSVECPDTGCKKKVIDHIERLKINDMSESEQKSLKKFIIKTLKHQPISESIIEPVNIKRIDEDLDNIGDLMRYLETQVIKKNKKIVCLENEYEKNIGRLAESYIDLYKKNYHNFNRISSVVKNLGSVVTNVLDISQK